MSNLDLAKLREVAEKATLWEEVKWERIYEMPNGRKHWTLTSKESRAEDRVISGLLVLMHSQKNWLSTPVVEMPEMQYIVTALNAFRPLLDRLEAAERRVVELEAQMETLSDHIRAAVAASEGTTRAWDDVKAELGLDTKQPHDYSNIEA